MYPANITRAEATARAGQVSTSSYEVLIDLSGRPVEGTDANPGTFLSDSTIRFSGSGSWVNLIAERMLQATLDGLPLPATAFADNKVSFEAESGDHELRVVALCRYSRTGEGLHRFVDPVDGRPYLYTQLETADARRVYACFEQPDLKATFTLSVIAPESWQVLSNSPAVAPTPCEAGLVRFDFAPTPPISTYITALVAGEFHTVHDTHAGRAGEIPLSLSCRQSVKENLDAERIFAITKAGFDVFEKHFDFPYPFADYAQIFVPEFNAGAMENAGCVTIRDEYLFRSRTTNAAYESRDNTILHELAHMWFGDLVTMTWWDDLWLNESFAEWASHFAQQEIRAALGTGDDPWATFSNSRKTWAYRQDQLPSTHPIAADMVDLEAVELNFDGITYAKGASALRQLVAFVGQDAFLAGVRTYFARHAWGTTTLSDLLTALTESSGRDLSHFASQWLQTSGVNTLSAEFEVGADGKFTRFGVRQSAAQLYPTLRHHRLAIGLYTDQDGRLTRAHRFETDIEGEFTELPELVGVPAADLVLVNDDDLTYAKIRLDQGSLHTLVTRIGDLDDPLARALCWGAAWDMCRDAEFPAADYVTLALSGVGAETDLTAVGAVLAQSRAAIDYYTPVTDRDELNERFALGVARLLKDAAPGSDHQLAFARSFTQAARSDATLAVLLAWLSGEEAPAGLAIDPDLRWLIVTQLAREGVIGEAEIEAEAARDATAQGTERAAGARAALPTPEAKQWAWHTATSGVDVPNETHYQICTQFWQQGQEEVLAPYVQAYLEVTRAISQGDAGWSERSSAIRQHVLGLLFPRPLVTRGTMRLIELWRAGVELSGPVARQFDERTDDAERALRCQEAVATPAAS